MLTLCCCRRYLCAAAESDSANLDHMAELLVRTGFEPQESLMLLVPEAFRNHPDLMKEYPEVCGLCHARECVVMVGGLVLGVQR
jgi:glutamate synthase domain-containing protein 1